MRTRFDWTVATDGVDSVWLGVNGYPVCIELQTGPSGSYVWYSPCCSARLYHESDPGRTESMYFNFGRCSQCNSTYDFVGTYTDSYDATLTRRGGTHGYIAHARKKKRDEHVANMQTIAYNVGLTDSELPPFMEDLDLILAALAAGERHRRALRVKGEGRRSDLREGTRLLEGMGLYFLDHDIVGVTVG